VTTQRPDGVGFLAVIDTFFLATASADGQPYIQHRGGPKGFLRVVDERTLGFADFKGNRQYITAGNLAENRTDLVRRRLTGLRRSVPQRHVADFVRHHAGDFGFAPGGLHHQ